MISSLAAIGARSLALQVLLECRQKNSFVHEIFDEHLRRSPLSDADRRLSTELVYGVLRRRGTLDFLLRRHLRRPMSQIEPWIIEALRLGAYQLFLLTHIPPHAALNETVELAETMHARRAKGFLNGVLRALLPLVTEDYDRAPGVHALPLTQGRYRSLSRPVLPDPAISPVEYLAHGLSLPAWLAERWYQRFGWDECLRLGFWFAGPAPLTLRVNRLRCERDSFLSRAGDNARAGSHSQAVIWRARTPVREIPGFKEGLFVVQDESAMRVVSVLAPRPGDKVLDLCAAPGGKTTHLAELMENQGSIMACDVDEHKLEPLEETCRRLGITIVHKQVVDDGRSAKINGIAPEGRAERLDVPPPGPFDAVLVDAPCSNTGVLGRRPEARWRLKRADLTHLIGLQKELLNQGCDRVRRGGAIVYSTCSIEREENREVVDSILKARDDFVLEADEEAIPGRPADGGYWAKLRRRG